MSKQDGPNKRTVPMLCVILIKYTKTGINLWYFTKIIPERI